MTKTSAFISTRSPPKSVRELAHREEKKTHTFLELLGFSECKNGKIRDPRFQEKKKRKSQQETQNSAIACAIVCPWENRNM